MKYLILLALLGLALSERARTMDEPYYHGPPDGEEPAEDRRADTIDEPSEPNSEYDTGKRETGHHYPDFDALAKCYERKHRSCTMNGDCVQVRCIGPTKYDVSSF